MLLSLLIFVDFEGTNVIILWGIFGFFSSAKPSLGHIKFGSVTDEQWHLPRWQERETKQNTDTFVGAQRTQRHLEFSAGFFF